MPWTAKDAHKHTHAAVSKNEKKQWADVANSVYKRTGSESLAIREANSVVARGKGK